MLCVLVSLSAGINWKPQCLEQLKEFNLISQLLQSVGFMRTYARSLNGTFDVSNNGKEKTFQKICMLISVFGHFVHRDISMTNLPK